MQFLIKVPVLLLVIVSLFATPSATFWFKLLKKAKWTTFDGKPTALHAHRGERILFPENSLPAYETAAILGADFIEADLVLTKDGILVCHHDLFLKDTTNVEEHPEFSQLKRDYVAVIGYDHVNVSGDWFIKDFTLAQLKTLRLKQTPVGIRPDTFNSLFEIPTFVEFLDLIRKMSLKLHKRIGIIPELKYPNFHNNQEGRPTYFMEDQFLRIMTEKGYLNSLRFPFLHPLFSRRSKMANHEKIIVQCFEADPLLYILKHSDFTTVFLIDNQVQHLTYKGIQNVALSGIHRFGIWKEYLFVGTQIEADFLQYSYNKEEIQELGGFVPKEKLVKEVHRNGMRFDIYTIKESHEEGGRGCATVPGCYANDKPKEMNYYLSAGVDGMFVEGLAESIEIRNLYDSSTPNSVKGWDNFIG